MNPSRTVTQRLCAACGLKFRARRSNSKYCSAACRQAAHRARDKLPDLDHQIEAARLLYWRLIAEKAAALGCSQSDVLTTQSQYVDEDGNVWIGGVLGGGGWRLAGRRNGPVRSGFSGWGLEAAGGPWSAPPASGRMLRPQLRPKRKAQHRKRDGLSPIKDEKATKCDEA